MENLQLKAKELRKKVLDLAVETNDAHLGGSFSEIELLLTLYNGVLKSEDKFILSKGHCPYPLYLILKENGLNPDIKTHPDIDSKNGIYCTTGSLGHGLPIGIGMAFARKLENRAGHIYVLMGDGECEEGTTWESALIASKYNLNNLTLVVDRNNLQALEKIVLPLGDLSEKFRAFGWNATNFDGHKFEDIFYAFNQRNYNAPNVLVAQTVKGKGISFMENDPKWHARMPSPDEIERAYKEIEGGIK